MGDLLDSFWTLACDLFKSQRRLQAENRFLRHQLNIALRRGTCVYREHKHGLIVVKSAEQGV